MVIKIPLSPVVVKQAENIPNSRRNVNTFSQRLRTLMEQTVAHALIADDHALGAK